MSEQIPRRIKKVLSRDKMAAEREKISQGGLHFGDYRPRYQETYDIYEKAKNHVREQKNKIKKNVENN